MPKITRQECLWRRVLASRTLANSLQHFARRRASSVTSYTRLNGTPSSRSLQSSPMLRASNQAAKECEIPCEMNAGSVQRVADCWRPLDVSELTVIRETVLRVADGCADDDSVPPVSRRRTLRTVSGDTPVAAATVRRDALGCRFSSSITRFRVTSGSVGRLLPSRPIRSSDGRTETVVGCVIVRRTRATVLADTEQTAAIRRSDHSE